LESDPALGPIKGAPRRTPADGTGVEPPASFDDWLDGRLKTLYQAVVSEPLPAEILELLGGSDEKK
jgi:hypothetical protein